MAGEVEEYDTGSWGNIKPTISGYQGQVILVSTASNDHWAKRIWDEEVWGKEVWSYLNDPRNQIETVTPEHY